MSTDYARFWKSIHAFKRHTSFVWIYSQLQIHTMLYVYKNIPKYRHHDVAYCYIIVPNKSQSLCCRRKKAFIFHALKLEIYLKYAFNLNLCYYNFE